MPVLPFFSSNSKRHLTRQFPRFLHHPLGLGLQGGNLLLQFFTLRGECLLSAQGLTGLETADRK